VQRVVINGDHEVVTTVNAPNMQDALAMIQVIKRLDVQDDVSDRLEEIAGETE